MHQAQCSFKKLDFRGQAQGHSDPIMVRDTSSFQDASVQQI